MKNEFFISVLLTVLLLLFLGCGSDSKDELIPLNSIEIQNLDEYGNIRVRKGDSLQIDVKTNPNVSIDNLVFESGYTNAFTVTSSGIIIALQDGEGELTVKSYSDFSIYTRATVLIDPLLLESLEILNLEDGKLVVESGVKHQIKVKGLPENASMMKFGYESKDTSVFSVDENGFITGVAEGEAELRVFTQDGSNIEKQCIVKVNRTLVHSMIVKNATAFIGSTLDLKPNITYTPAKARIDDLKYTSSDEAIAKVSSTGIVTGVSSGVVQIKMETTDGSNITTTCDVVVGSSYVAIDRSGFSVECSSQTESDGGGKNMILNDEYDKYWHSQWDGGNAPLPHWLTMKMDQPYEVSKILIGRRVESNGGINTDTRLVEVLGSTDGIRYKVLGAIDFGDSKDKDMYIEFYPEKIQYIKVDIVESNRNPFANISILKPYVIK